MTKMPIRKAGTIHLTSHVIVIIIIIIIHRQA
jgi:hypothetical protein